MLIFSVKAQNIKLFCAVFFSLAAIVLCVALFPQEDAFIYPAGVIPSVRELTDKDFSNIKTNEDRLNLLRKFGWETDSDETEIVEVVIPAEFDLVYKKYNEIQLSEGLDLSKYKGKTVKRYTYTVRNFDLSDYSGTVYANLLIYKNKVIGGDISSAASDGFVRGLSKGNNFIM